MPRALVWLTTWLMLLAMVVTPIVYVEAMSDDPVVEAATSPDADSWGIPMFGGVFLALFIVTPIALILTRTATRRYGRPHLFIWRRDRLRRSIVATIISGTVVVGLAAISVQDFLSLPPAYEVDAVPVVVLMALWVLMLRACFVGRGDQPQAAGNGVASR